MRVYLNCFLMHLIGKKTRNSRCKWAHCDPCGPQDEIGGYLIFRDSTVFGSSAIHYVIGVDGLNTIGEERSGKLVFSLERIQG
jgi:hypothetical protein